MFRGQSGHTQGIPWDPGSLLRPKPLRPIGRKSAHRSVHLHLPAVRPVLPFHLQIATKLGRHVSELEDPGSYQHRTAVVLNATKLDTQAACRAPRRVTLRQPSCRQDVGDESLRSPESITDRWDFWFCSDTSCLGLSY